MGSHGQDGLFFQKHIPAIGDHVANDHLEQGGFSSPVIAHHSDKFILFNGQVQARKQGLLALDGLK
jgi:hypothetical protein